MFEQLLNNIKFSLGILVVPFYKREPGAIIPKYSSEGAAGFDFHCNEDVEVKPFERKLVSTGIAAAVPKGFELRIQARSSTGTKTPLILANSIGCVDSDYRGIVYLAVQNLSDSPYTIKKGDRIAQGIISAANQVKIKEDKMGNISETKRGEGGFGSTGSN